MRRENQPAAELVIVEFKMADLSPSTFSEVTNDTSGSMENKRLFPLTNRAMSLENGLNSSKPVLSIDMQFNDGHIVSIIFYAVLIILSAVGNITVLSKILRRKRPNNSLSRVDFLLVHLGIADLIVTFFMCPLEIGWAATVYWRAGDFLCRFFAFFRIFGLYLSGFVLVCLAVDRYLAVRYPMQSRASTKRAKMMVTVAWLLSIACSCPQIYVFHLESHPDFPWYTQCVTFHAFSKPVYDMMYKLFGMVMMCALPLTLLVLLYSSIAFELCRMSNSTGAFSSDGLRRSGVRNIERAKVKSIKMTFVITAVFIVCWCPYWVMSLWYWVAPESAKNVDQRIQKGLFLFAVCNSTMNPIVYGLFHTKSLFRRNSMRRRVDHQRFSTRSHSVPSVYHHCGRPTERNKGVRYKANSIAVPVESITRENAVRGAMTLRRSPTWNEPLPLILINGERLRGKGKELGQGENISGSQQVSTSCFSSSILE